MGQQEVDQEEDGGVEEAPCGHVDLRPQDTTRLATLIFHFNILLGSHSTKFQSTKTLLSLDLFS